MIAAVLRASLTVFVLAAACSRSASPGLSDGAVRGLSDGAPAPSALPPAISAGTPCGPLDCKQFDQPRDAFLEALSSDPLVVGIGEAHRPADLPGSVGSATSRFSDQLLPTLSGRASDLLIELMLPPQGCADAAAQVRAKQSVVTAKQAPTNQNEYVAMGDRARKLAIVPDMLRPACTDMDAVRDAGDAIDASLVLIARLFEKQAERLVDRDARSDADQGKVVVLYGGALHNDLAPSPDTARWSYAPALDAYVQGRFVAVDLIVPEFIRDDATWRALPWVKDYDVQKLGAKTTLFRTGDKSYVLVFPAAPGP
jgi:hypothetical protein